MLKQILTAYKEYELLFQEGPRNKALLKHQLQDYEIPIKLGKSLTFRLIYQLSKRELKALKEYINVNLKKGFIRLSTLPIASSVLFVLKKDRLLQLVIDYQQPNNITVKDRYILPLINELQNKLQKAKYFTSLDLQGAYYLIQIKESKEQKIAFYTQYSLYKNLVIIKKLTNALSSF